jgi:hypothetical protein
MPCINRIRIINFSYNSDARHILDETFNFHGGENVLLNLANGGGKSVLVQLMLQPVVPRARIQGRHMADFFKKQKRPSYVLIEWKLDGAGGYLLTGIGMASEETRSTDEDERGRIRLFCFLCSYHHSYSHDLDNIDLVRHEGGIVLVTPYKAAQDMLREAARKDPFAVSYFPQSELEEHRHRLLQFGISQDEWSNVMKRINDSEGGLEEIFAKCKTSDQLLDIWLMHTIEKNLPTGAGPSSRDGHGPEGGAGHGLQRMFENLLEETLNSEGLLLEHQRLARFLPNFEELKDQASDLAGRLEKCKTTGEALSALYGWLGVQARRFAASGEITIQALRELEGQNQRVLQEERSETVHAIRAAWEAAVLKLAAAEEDRKAAELGLFERESAWELMKAARIHGERERLSAALAEVVDQMRGVRVNDDRSGRMDNLRAALWVRWVERYSGQEQATMQSVRILRKAEERHGFLRDREIVIRMELTSLEREQKELSRNLTRFEEREQQACILLELELSRNLAGELDGKERNRVTDRLTRRQGETKAANSARIREEAEISEALPGIEKEYRKEMALRKDLQDERQLLEKETEQWRNLTLARTEVLRRHGLGGTESRELGLSELRRIQYDLSHRISLTEQELHETASLQEDLRHGRFHVSADWIRHLTEAGIAHQTGEAYLRLLDQGEREHLLDIMPFLPYAILLATEALERLPELMQSEVRRGVTPLLTYEALKNWLYEVLAEKMNRVGRTITLSGGKLMLASLYNKDALAPDTVGRLMDETDIALQRLGQSLENLQVAHSIAMRDYLALESHPYPEDWKTVQDAKLKRILRSSDTASERMAALEKTIGERETRKGALLRALIPESREAVRLADEHAKTWQDLMEANNRYEEERRKQTILDGRMRGLDGELAAAVKELDGLDLTIRRMDQAHSDAERLEREYRLNRDKYAEWSPEKRKHFDEPSLPEGSCESLEGQLTELLNALGMELRLLERRHDDLSKDAARVEREWRKLSQTVPETALLPQWDEMSEERIERDASTARQRFKIAGNEANAAALAQAPHAERLKAVMERLAEVGLSEPLPKSDIRGKYPERKREIEQTERELKWEALRIAGLQQRIEKDLGRILDAGIDPNQVRPMTSYQVQEDWKVQLDLLLEALRTGAKEAGIRKDAFRIRYDKVRNEHAAASGTIHDLFDGLDAMLERATDSYEPFYFLYERMQDHIGILAQQIARLKANLEGLERSRSDVVEHCFMHGRRMVEELQRIEQNSMVRLEGRSGPTSMLRVGMKLDGEKEARTRIALHVEKSIELMKEEVRSGKDIRQARPAIERLIRSRELLNKYLGTERIPIHVFKIDLNMGNSKFKVWEDAVRENSGGEKFVVYFSVLTALMAYTRAAEQAALSAPGEQLARDARHVLIMDNPFGPISSQHLLKPLFEIAKRYGTQLICLTDLKQSSILNNFNLVYMLRVRKGAASADEYLKFEEFKRSQDVPESEEALEKAFYRVSDFTQMKLW